MSLVSARPISAHLPCHSGISHSPTKYTVPMGRARQARALPLLGPTLQHGPSHCCGCSISVLPRPDTARGGGWLREPIPAQGRQGRGHGAALHRCPHTEPCCSQPRAARIWPMELEWWIKSLAWSLTHQAVLARKHVLHLILRVFLHPEA